VRLCGNELLFLVDIFDAFGEKKLEKSGTAFYLVRLVIEKAE
jgi:hypothetical protein